MTQKTKILLFDHITDFACANPSNEKMGEMVLSLLNANNCIAEYEKYKNPANLNKEAKEVVHAYQSGWKFYRVDGVIWYYANNIEDGGGPWANGGYGSPNLRVVSSRMINKLVACGQFPKNYKFSS